MLDRVYLEELARLKELAGEFAEAHPALAPMLGGASADPDLERLFQGVALQLAQLRERLDDDFPEFIHALARQLCPQLLRPIPATTIVAFSPKPTVNGTRVIEAGTQLASVPVAGTTCLFRTCAPVELHPLELRQAGLAQPPGQAPAVSLSFALTGISLADWKPRGLRLFLAEDYPAAAELYYLLCRQLRRIVITPEGDDGLPIDLPPACLQPAGFGEEDPVIPYPSHVFPGYRVLQEFFSVTNRFLFLDLVGWERWTRRGSGSRFTVSFELAGVMPSSLRVRSESFAIFATPVVNLFGGAARPFHLDPRKERYLVLPDGLPREHAQVYSVDRVTGHGHGSGKKRSYRPREQHRPATSAEPVFSTSVTASLVRSGCDLYLSFCHPDAGLWQEGETISVDLTCSNGTLPENLGIGDVCRATSSSPEWATFSNVAPITPGVQPPLGEGLLWRLVSHQALNLSSLIKAESLRDLLRIYLFDEGSRHHLSLAAHLKRIDSIEEVSSVCADRVVRGVPIRGTEISVRINGAGYAGMGDLFIFGSVLDSFLAGCASLNSFTRLTIHETTRGETIEWQPRLGEQPLI